MDKTLSNITETSYKETIFKLKRRLDFVAELILDREDIIEQFAYALLTRNHLLMLGRTGVAKSMLAHEIFRLFSRDGMSTFFIKASVEDTKDNYFGPINVIRYKEQGEKIRKIKNSILDAHFAFIDEIFDTNEQILRDLMLVLSDRRLLEGAEEYRAPLHTVIAASNYLRLNEVTEAVIDRFYFKSNIPHETETFTQYRIDMTYLCDQEIQFALQNPITYEEICQVTDIVLGHNEKEIIEIPDEILYLKNIILRNYIDAMRKQDQNFYISPRRQAKVVDLLRAMAVWDNRNVVTEADLRKMFLGICTLHSQTGEVRTFKKTTQETLQMLYADPAEKENLIFLTSTLRFIEEVKKKPDEINLPIPELSTSKKTWKDKFMNFFLGDRATKPLTLDMVTKRINEVKPSVIYIEDLKNGCLREVQKLREIQA